MPDTTSAPPEGHTSNLPAEAAPERGAVQVKIAGQTVRISEVEHWIEDGIHVFRSVEFDCIAEHEDEGDAVRMFIENAEDLYRYLDDLVDAGRATQDEIRTFAMMGRRFYEIYTAQAQAAMRRKVHVLTRSRDLYDLNWHRLPTQSISSPPVHA
jgi:hypothetical protein